MNLQCFYNIMHINIIAIFHDYVSSISNILIYNIVICNNLNNYLWTVRDIIQIVIYIIKCKHK